MWIPRGNNYQVTTVQVPLRHPHYVTGNHSAFFYMFLRQYHWNDALIRNCCHAIMLRPRDWHSPFSWNLRFKVWFAHLNFYACPEPRWCNYGHHPKAYPFIPCSPGHMVSWLNDVLPLPKSQLLVAGFDQNLPGGTLANTNFQANNQSTSLKPLKNCNAMHVCAVCVLSVCCRCAVGVLSVCCRCAVGVLSAVCVLCAVCCALCPVRCALCALRSALCALRSALCALRSALCALHSALCALRSALCALRSALCAVRSALCALRSALCPLRSALCTLRSALCALRSALCALRSALCAVRSALCALRSVLCAVRCALCSVRCALCAVRCALCCVCVCVPNLVPQGFSLVLPFLKNHYKETVYPTEVTVQRRGFCGGTDISGTLTDLPVMKLLLRFSMRYPHEFGLMARWPSQKPPKSLTTT